MDNSKVTVARIKSVFDGIDDKGPNNEQLGKVKFMKLSLLKEGREGGRGDKGGFLHMHERTVVQQQKAVIDAARHDCPFEDCTFTSHRLNDTKVHTEFVHNIGVTWHRCLVCSYRAKRKCDVTQHVVMKHATDTLWHRCKQCDFKTKKKSNIKQHSADKHDVGVTWHACTELVCEYRAKRESNLKRHRAAAHG